MAVQEQGHAQERRSANYEMAVATNWHIRSWDPAIATGLTEQEEGEHTLDLFPVNKPAPTFMDLTTSSASMLGNAATDQSCEATATAMDVVSLDSEQETLATSGWDFQNEAMSSVGTQMKRPLVWHSGPYQVDPDRTGVPPITALPASSDAPNLPPFGGEIIVLSSSEDDVPKLRRTAAEPIIISSDTSETGDHPTLDADSNDFDYDPAEKLPIKKQKRHYYELGRRMETYTEMRLKRIIDHPNSSNEDFQEAQYQLHIRYPKHKRGRAVEAWRK